ncbi:MAG: helix-turn-helix domain-containing protein [Flavobacteriaceae bacterium]|nr:helix-turn-helix domain-containing protein [Flavobacteriaceae bacterium]
MKYYQFIVLSFVMSFAHSQDRKQITFSQLSVNEGLSQNSVVSIAQDTIGYLWFATQDGLNKYNGLEFEYYPILFDDVTKENYSRLGKVFINSANEIFVIGKGGQLQKHNTKTDSFEPVLRFEDVSTLEEGKDKSVWIGTYSNGLYQINSESKDTLAFLQNESALTAIYDLYNYETKMVVASSNSIYIMDEEGSGLIKTIERDHTNFSSLAEANNKLWIGSFGKGLFYSSALDSLSIFNGFSESDALPGDLNILSLLRDQQQRLWVGTYGDGAYLIDFKSEQIQHFVAEPRNPKAIHYNDILSIYEDHTGTIWLGTDGAGLSYYDENLSKFNVLTNYQTPIYTDIDVIRAITKDKNGNLWLGSSGKGLTMVTPDQSEFKTFVHDPNDTGSIVSNRIMSLMSNDDELWIGFQDEGLSVYEGGNSFKHFSGSSNPPLMANTIWCFLKDSQNRIWLGTRDNGLIQFDMNKGVIAQHIYDPNDNNSVSSNNIRVIVEASDGNLWLGTENNGLNKFFVAEGNFRRYTQVSIANIKSLYEDKDKLWIGTNGNGLLSMQLNNSELTSYTTNEGLPNNVVYAVLPDEQGNLWLSSNRGITKLNADNRKEVEITNYDIYDGLQALEFNTGAYYKDDDGLLYFGGLKGINWLNPKEITNNTAPPRTIIYKLDLFNEEIALDSERKFNSGENTISFTFAGLHFSQPERNEYRYILENYEDSWTGPTKNNYAHYTNLPPGEYTFNVVSSNYDGVWDSTPASYSFTISKPWFLTNVARISYILLGIALLYLIYLYFKWRWSMQLKLRLEHEETERLQKLDDLKTKLYTNISHEFRTPLTLISGPVQQLLNTAGLSEKDKQSLSIIEGSSERMLRLINQMLDLSKLEERSVKLRVTRNDLKPQLIQIVESFMLRANEKAITVHKDIQEFNESWYDRDIIDKIVTNLMSNAIKYAPENSDVNLAAKQIGDNLLLRVSNANTSLSESHLPKLFDRFYQHDKTSPGTGIGLSLIKELITLCGGKIRALKDKENEICFEAIIPVSRGSYNANTVIPEDTSYDFLHNEAEELFTNEDETPVMLVVEDNIELRSYIGALFRGSFEVLQAGDGNEGIKLAIARVPDIIISDIMMPEKDGIELTNTLKTDVRSSHIPILLLTAKTGTSNELKGLSSKADDYITKPFNAEILKQKVRNYIEMRKALQKRYSQHLYLKPKDISVTSVDEQLLEDIQKIIDTRITEPDFTVGPFAEELGLSRMQLHRKLKALTGLSASEFIRSQRLKSSTKLMETSDRSISEIAYSVGFNSPSYFIKCFKEAYGLTPTEYIKNL